MGDGIVKNSLKDNVVKNRVIGDFLSVTRFMTFVFVIFFVVCVIGVFVYFNSNEDDTSSFDLKDAFVVSTVDEFFILEDYNGAVEFRVDNMSLLDSSNSAFKRVLISYEYRIVKGEFDLSKIAFAASYLEDRDSPFGVNILPWKNEAEDLSVSRMRKKSDDYQTEYMVIEVPKDVEKIYVDIGGSASMSGKSSWFVYDLSEFGV